MTLQEQKKFINNGFQSLRELGLIAQQVPSKPWQFVGDVSGNALAYSSEDLKNLKKNKILYISWSGDGETIFESLKKVFGKFAKWDRKMESRMKIDFNEVDSSILGH